MSSLGAQSRLEWPNVKIEENGGRWCGLVTEMKGKRSTAVILRPLVLMFLCTQKDVKLLDLYVEIKMNCNVPIIS